MNIINFISVPSHEWYILGGRRYNEILEDMEEGDIDIKCRSVRIGSYKTLPQEHVILTKKSLFIFTPPIDEEPRTGTSKYTYLCDNV